MIHRREWRSGQSGPRCDAPDLLIEPADLFVVGWGRPCLTITGGNATAIEAANPYQSNTRDLPGILAAEDFRHGAQKNA